MATHSQARRCIRKVCVSYPGDRSACSGSPFTHGRFETRGWSRTYAITPEGRRALDAWLQEPSTAQVELRHPGLLKLFFSELADDDAFRALAREQAAAHRATLARYEWLERRYGDRPEYARRMLPLRAGFTMERGLIAFWDEIAEM